jgi:hypothetical protein
MRKIYSKVEPDKLLCVLVKSSDMSEKRLDMTSDSEVLQAAAKSLQKGLIVAPHKHKRVRRETDITQEAWVFLTGSVKAAFYDLDDTKSLEVILEAGDCAVMLNGGHAFEVLEDNTLFYEFKTGPYMGYENDKESIQ